MTTKEVAGRLKCATRTVRAICERLKIPKNGRDYVLTEAQVKMIEKKLQPGPGWQKGRKRKNG